MYENYSMPIYQKIAIDIANSIYKGEFEEGNKLHGRSTLASKYHVSPETIRRAIKLLEDIKVVVSSKGSGITVLSKDNALTFINKFKNVENIGDCKNSLFSLIQEKKKLEDEILNSINKIVDYSGRLMNTNPLIPVEVEIPETSHLVNKSISEVNFWQNTGATIVGIKSPTKLTLSPGPYATFNSGDIILVIGNGNVQEVVRGFLNQQN